VKAVVAHFGSSSLKLAGRWLAVSGLSLLVLGGCAAVERIEVAEGARAVEQRALERWNYLIGGQWEKAYEYFSPTSRSTLPLEVFRRRSAGGQWWRTISVDKVDCRPESCRVTMTLKYDLKEIKGLTRIIEETWINEAGTWWLVAGLK
jgi:hypothetical protein